MFFLNRTTSCSMLLARTSTSTVNRTAMLFNKPFLLGGTSRFNFSTASSSKEKVKDDLEGFARLTKHYKER